MENQPPAEHIEWADYVSIETTCASDLFSRSLESLHRSYGWRSLSNVRGHSSSTFAHNAPQKACFFGDPAEARGSPMTLAQR